MTESDKPSIAALVPDGDGHQFVVYGDACSGVAGALHETTFAAVNSVVRQLEPKPEFIIFTGDEVIGLTADRNQLEAQWRHWLDHEMAWLDRAATPMWHCTGNHTTYDRTSEDVFRDVLQLPRNGPVGQEGLSYWVRRGDLLMVFVHTLWTGLGGEGYVETEWLERTLRNHSDAKHRLVVGHHPAFPVNGYAGDYQRTIAPECVSRFWDILVAHNVSGYICSHILAYDVQVHHGVLQICSAGAGTAHRMPEGDEYLHAMQVAVDDQGLRWQVIDTEGRVREALAWPRGGWSFGETQRLPSGCAVAGAEFGNDEVPVLFQFEGTAMRDGNGDAQTFLALGDHGELPSLWVGLRGVRQRLTVIIGNEPGRSPHYWIGPKFSPGGRFSMELLLHFGMGPGGLLWRSRPDVGWNSLAAASSWGLERLRPAPYWCVGHSLGSELDSPFRGEELSVHFARASLNTC